MCLAVGALALAGADQPPGRIDRREGYIELEGDAGAPAASGSYSVVPAPKGHAKPAPSQAGEETWSEDQSPPPPPRPTPREACQPQANRFASRLAVLRGNTTDAGREPLDPAVQRAMFGRTALRTPSSDPDQPVPELTWDEELKDLYRAYQMCVKAAGQRAR